MKLFITLLNSSNKFSVEVEVMTLYNFTILFFFFIINFLGEFKHHLFKFYEKI